MPQWYFMLNTFQEFYSGEETTNSLHSEDDWIVWLTVIVGQANLHLHPWQMDPVQKAVINHTFGVAQPKKKQIISCNICHLRFNSTVSQLLLAPRQSNQSCYIYYI